MLDSIFKQSHTRPIDRPRNGAGLLGLADWLIFSSGIAAGVALVLTSAASLALGHAPLAAVVVLAAAGTLVIYNVDRLRDLDRDRASSPERTAFVELHRRALRAVIGLGGLASFVAAITLPPAVWLLCAGGLAVGLLHRRIKHRSLPKSVYVSGVWIAVVVGLPAAAQGFALDRLALVAAVLGCAIYANLLASNLRSGDQRRGLASASPRHPPHGLASAIGIAALGAALAWLGPAEVRALAAIALGQAVALCFYRSDERFALLVIDGGLLVGGSIALVIQLST